MSENIIFHNVIGFDRLNDTLISAEKISASLEKYDRTNHLFELGKIELDNTLVHFNNFDSIHRINIYPIINKFFSGTDSVKKNIRWTFIIDAINARNSLFSYQTYNRTETEHHVNFNDLCFRNLNFRIQHFKAQNDTVCFDVRSMNFTEKSGFNVNDFSTKMVIAKTCIHSYNAIFITPFSTLNAQQAFLDFKSADDFNNLFEKVKLNLRLNESKIDFRDVASFAGNLPESGEKISITGMLKGTISNLTCKDIVVNYGKHTHFAGSINFDGLPDIKSTFVYFDTHLLTTRFEDIETLMHSFSHNQKQTLPDIFHKLGKMSFSGSFSGFFNDFVAYGNLNSELGKISSDILIKPDNNNSLQFKGRLAASDFNLGALLNDSSELGLISLNINVDGFNHLSDENINAEVEGMIQKIEINKYSYRNINLKGQFTNKSFNGNININDPNLNMNFMGNIDYSSTTPRFKFNVALNNARLYNLNIDKGDTSQTLSCIISGDFTGSSPEDFTGDIVLNNILFRETGKKFELTNITVSANNNVTGNSLELKSDILDAEIYGKYSLQSFAGTFKDFIKNYLPDSYFSHYLNNKPDTCFLEFDIDFKKMKSFTGYFYPSLVISDQSVLMGKYNPATFECSISGSFNELAFKGNSFRNLQIYSESGDKEISFVAGCESLDINKQIQFKNLLCPHRPYTTA